MEHYGRAAVTMKCGVLHPWLSVPEPEPQSHTAHVPEQHVGGKRRSHHYRRSTTNKAPRKRTFIMHMTKYISALVPRLGSEKGGFGFSGYAGPLYDEDSPIARLPSDSGNGGAGHDRNPSIVSSHRVQTMRHLLARNAAVLVGAAAMGPALGLISATSLLLAQAASVQLELATLKPLPQHARSASTAPATAASNTQPPAPKKRSSPFETALQAAVDNQSIHKRSRISGLQTPALPGPIPPTHPTRDTCTAPVISSPSRDPARYLDSTLLRLAPLNIQLGPQLGTGAHGTVYSGTWKGQAVAVKLPNIAYHLASGTLSEADGSLAREAALLPTLKHPNIVACLHAVAPGCDNNTGDAPVQPALVIELLPLGSLDALLHGGAHAAATCAALLPHVLLRHAAAPMHGAPAAVQQPQQQPDPSPAAVRAVHLSLLRDAAAALQHLHSLPSPVVHRDLKPDNILVSADGSAKLSDFGVAVVLGDDAYAAAAEVLGTVQYTAPEDLWGSNQRHVHPAADIFSLGCILWEILSRQRPWAGLDAVQVMYGVGHKGRRLPVNAAWPADLVQLLHGCWAADLTMRPTAAEAVAALDAHLGALVGQLVGICAGRAVP